MMQLIAHITTAVILLTPVLSSGQCMTYPVPFAQRIQNSNLVIEGRVISQNAFWNTSGDFIYTSSIVEVNKLFKGTISTNQIEVITEGGIIGNMMIKAEPALQLKVDQIGVFMGVSSAIAGSTSNLPLSSKFEGVAANQSFVTYDTKAYTATDPFNNYQDITTEIYQFIPSVTGIPYVELIPFNLYPSQNLGPGINTQMVPPIISAITSPSTAGTFTTITITGNNFGAGPFGGSRALEFRDANNGGAGFIPTPANHIISWSNTSIQAWVPTQAGSGNIRVTNDLGESTVSGVTTTIDYNQTNVVSGGLYYQPDLINDNGAGGYTFQYNTTFSANAGAVAAFERALQTWRCGTFVNFNKSGTTAVACQALDNINLVTFDGSCSLPSGVLGVSYSYYSGCGGGVWYLNENDLKFRTNGTNGINWNFGPAATAGGLFDFESVAVHELGHSHQLGHTISPITVMHYAIGPNTDRRTLTASSETAGGTNIMTRSVNTNSCGPTAMASLNAGSCAINAPIANFTGNPTTGCNSLNVTFTDASIGSPTSWSWSFPGGVPNSFSGQTPPAINYAAPGTYSVTLTVTNAFGSDSETKNNFISVNNCPPPVADFLANPTTACVGQTINFTDISINNPTSWSWSFPGGTPNASTFTNPAVTYATPGTYDVTMTATNAYGSNTITKSSFITVTTCPSPPAPSFTATQTTICAGGQVTFTDQSTNNPTSWQWTFTGGSPTTSIAQNPTVTYPSAGTYPVSLVATNSAGSNSITVTGYVTVNVCSPPVVDFAGWPTTICQGTSVSFTDLSTNSPTSWSWTFPGGTPAAVTTSSASITYNIVGTYNVTLQATNAFGTGALTKNTYITVNSCPPAGTGLIVNDGSLIHVEAGALVTVQGGIINQDNTISNIGSIDNWGLITLTGDWTNNSSSTALINASPGTVDLLGSSQNISGSGITNFYNLNLSGTGIKFMNVNSRVLGTLALNDRELNTQSYWMHVINPDPNAITRTGTLSGTPVQGFVSSTGAGRLKRNTNSTLGYLFPVGSSQGSTPRFRPVELTPTSSDPHTLASRFVNNDPSADGLSVLQKDATIGFVNSQWYQKINRESGLSNIDVRLYFESTADNIVPLPTLLMTQWSALAPIQWNPINSVAVTGVTSPGLSNTMRAGWTTFDTENFNLAPQSIPLPIELVDLTAKAAGDRILVDWITATEINNDGFELMRKFGLNDFVPIHWVDGQGTTNQTTTYQFIDRDVISGVTYYYRLKQYDFDGTTSLSEVVSAKITGNGASISAWPNPFAQTTQIVINLPLEEDVELLIVNSIGQVVSVLHKGILASGLHAFEFNTNTTGCSSGIYVAEVRMNGAVERIKIMSSD